MAYTPPVGDKVALDFAGGPYTPPVGDKVALDFGSGTPVGDTRYLFPLAWESSTLGSLQVTGVRLTPSGWQSSAFGSVSVVNAAKAAYPGGIAPPPSTGTNEFRQVPSPWISFWTRTLDLGTPSRGIGPPAFPTNHIVAFEIQTLDLAGRGINSAQYGTNVRVEFTSRSVYPFSITSQAIGTALVARVQVVQPSGWANATSFGAHQLDINLQRVLLVGHSIAAPTITDQHQFRNAFEYVRPQHWESLQFNFPVVYNLKQEVFVSKYASDADPTAWPPYYPFVENKIRYLRPSGWVSSRFSVIGNIVENGARALYASGWDSFSVGPSSFIAHSTRYLGAQGWDSFYSTQYHVAYNNAKLVLQTGWGSSVVGNPAQVLNLNRTVTHHSGPSDGFYGIPFVAFRVRSVLQRPFADPFWPVPEIRLNPYPIAPAGIAPPPSTAPSVREHFNILGPTSANVHSVPWVGEPFIRNRNMTVAVYPSDQSLYGRPRVFNYNTNLTGVSGGDMAAWGPVLVSYRTKTLYPAPISLPVFPVLHRIKNDAPDPPAVQRAIVPSVNINGDGTAGFVPKPTMNYLSVFPLGFRSSTFGVATAKNNGIVVPSMVNVDNFGVPYMVGAQYAFPSSIPRSIAIVPGQPIPATYGDSDDYWTKNLQAGYEWPRLSPHIVYAPRGDMATGQAIRNNPPFPEPEYHAIDGRIPAGYGLTRNPFFGETWVSLKLRTIGPAPNHSNPNTDKLSPSSVVSPNATVVLKQRWLFPTGIRSLRFGRIVFWGVPQYITLDAEQNGIPPGDAYIRGSGGVLYPPNNHTVFFKPLFNRPVYPAGSNMLAVGTHDVQNFNRLVYPVGIPHRGNPQQGLTSPWGTPLVGYPRKYSLGGYEFTLWGNTWVSHYTRYVGAQGWRSSTLEDYPISGFNDRMRVRYLPRHVSGASVGESLRIGGATVDFGQRSVIAHGFSGYNAGKTVVTSSCVILPAGWDSSEYGDIDRWEAGKVKAHGDDLSAVGAPKLRHPVRPPSFNGAVVGDQRFGFVVYATGLPPIGFAGPSVTDPFGCSMRVVSPLPILSQEFVPLPVVTR